MWGTTGIGYNVNAAREIIGSGEAIDSWDDVFDPAKIARFKDCGVHFLDSSEDIMSAALHYLQLDPNSSVPGDLQRAADLLLNVRPYVRKFHSSEYLNALASGEICLVVGFSGDIIQAQRRAAQAKAGVVIAYAIPKEGAQLWFDNLAIPSDAPDVPEAHALINYLLRPEVAAANTNFVSYANGNLASQKFIDKSILERSQHLSRCRDNVQALHHHGARSENAALHQPIMDANKDRPLGHIRMRTRPRRAQARIAAGNKILAYRFFSKRLGEKVIWFQLRL